MSYQIKVEFHPLYELVSSMMVFASYKNHYDLDKQWFHAIEEKLSSTFKDRIKEEEKLEDIPYIIHLMRLCPNKDSLADFLQWLHSFTVGEIYEMLFPYFGDYPVKDIGGFRDYFSELLTLWHSVYKIEEKTIEALNEMTNHLKEVSTTMDPVDFVENCTNGIRVYPKEELHHVILVPSIHTAPLNRLYGGKNILIVQFAVDPPNDDQTVPSIRFMRKTKALADPKRLRILQYLTLEPRTFTEIGKEMKLSKSNLHYHLMLLRTAGFLRITNFMFMEPDKYETRSHGFTALNEEIANYVFKDKVK
jgi:DNA-binding transcriptional ArsR family regulator